MQNSKFVGVCLLISSLILSAAIIYHTRASTQTTPTASGRYQFQSSNPPGVIWVIDTTAGEVKTQHG
jgi:hypothetical protein